MKAGELRGSTMSAAALAAKDKPLEARLFGYSILHHLVFKRWQEFGSQERTQLIRLALELVKDVSKGQPETWAVKCKSTALLAETLRQEGPDCWDAILTEV
eukprot:8176946-Pyramimonas_sp.AAC.2